MTPYYQDDAVTIYHGDCREIATVEFLHYYGAVVVTDPPYPNNGGHFDDAVDAAREWLPNVDGEAIVFWSELEIPPISAPLVAVHIWHRANVNGRPYEAAYHFCPSGIKRRSEVFRHAAIWDGATGSDAMRAKEPYLGHPTQKPEALMRQLLGKTRVGMVIDPFCGSGSTLAAAKSLGRKSIGIEVDERFCEIAANRCRQEVMV